MKKFLGAILPLMLIASCGGSHRTLLIVSPGKLTVASGAITIGDTTNGTANQEIAVTQSTYTVNNNGVKTTLTIPADAGYYIYNAGDTIYGSQLIEGRDYNHVLSLSEQKAMIDSVKKVLAGVNISAANKNYLITAGQIVKLNGDAAHTQVFPPYIPPTDIKPAADGKPVTLFKFYAKDELQRRLQTIVDSYNANNAGGAGH